MDVSIQIAYLTFCLFGESSTIYSSLVNLITLLEKLSNTFILKARSDRYGFIFRTLYGIANRIQIITAIYIHKHYIMKTTVNLFCNIPMVFYKAI